MEGFRLSPQQKHLWLQQHGESILPYCAQALIAIDGKVEAPTLNLAIEEALTRHEILHTNFKKLPGLSLPVQVLAETSKFMAQNYDWSHLLPSEQQTKVETLFAEMRRAAFDLTNGPALLLYQIVLSPSQRLLLVALPALCIDATGLDNFVQVLSRGYAERMGLVKNDSAEAANGIMQYADIAEWQNELLESEEGSVGREFWRKQNMQAADFGGVKLPFENPVAKPAGFAPALVRAAMPAELTAKITTIVKEYDLSTAALLLASFNVLLWRLTESRQLVIGWGCDGRKYDELKAALGLFAKYLPLPCALNAGMSFVDLVRQINQTSEELGEREEFFSWEQTDGVKNGTPAFFSYCFDFEAPLAKAAIGEVSFALQKRYVCYDRFKLKLVCVPNEHKIDLEFHYDTNLYCEADIERLAERFQAFLQRAIAHPQAKIGELEIVGAAERQQIVDDFNRTTADFPQDKCIHQLIEAQAERAPNQVAVVFEDHFLSYGELNARANQLARHLIKLGVTPETFVAICLERSPEMMIGILGVLKAGGVYVPMDPAYPRERLAFMLADTQAHVLLTQKAVIEKLQLQVENLTTLCLDTDWEPAVANENVANCDSGVRPPNLAYVIYTSGSTGKPKGVLVTHQNLVNSTSARLKYYRAPVDKFLLLSSFAFDSSIAGIFWTTCHGGTLCLLGAGLEKDPQQIIAVIAQNQITHMLSLPSLHNLILSQAQPSQLASLAVVIVAGEACPTPLTEIHQQRLAGAELFNEYGPTEGTVWSSVHEISAPPKSGQVPIGRPIANAQIYLQDEHWVLAPSGIAGELCVGGAGVTRGYLNRPELTAEKFIPNPYGGPGTRLYKTGDLARYPAARDGVLDFLGRLDHQVKIRGYRIELEEIEVVLGRHPSIQNVVVHAREDHPGEKRLVAYIVSHNGVAVASNELRDYLAPQLPEYMVPSAFVFLAALPLMPNGKVDRQALPAPEAVSSEKFVAPATPVEQVLAEIWHEVLRAEKVGRHDNYFELGGDSILTIRIIAKAREKGIVLTPRHFFQHQTIAELAVVASVSTVVSAEQGVVFGTVPLTPIQHWFFASNPANPDFWNMTTMLELEHAGDPEHWRKAVQVLLMHHDALRLRFRRDNFKQWQQSLAPLDEKAIPFHYENLSTLNAAKQMDALERESAKWKRSLRLAEGPLLRVVLFDFGVTQATKMLVCIHHLAVDVVSWQILLDDLRTAYRQVSNSETIKLPAKTTSYKEWAERLVQYTQSDVLQNELAYWLAEERRQVALLPVDFPEGENTLASAQTVAVSLNDEETSALLQEVPKVFRTEMNDVLLTALALALARWTGTVLHLVNLEGHGREEIVEDVDVSRTVGWFTNMYPVLLKIKDAADLRETLQTIKEQLRLVPNRGMGYGLWRYLSHEQAAVEKLLALPPAQVNFNYLGQLQAEHLTGVTPFQLMRDVNGLRDMLLEFVGFIVDGCLQMNITYSGNIHRRATIEALGQNFVEALRAFVVQSRTSAGSYRAADFSEANLSQEELDSLLAEINQ